MSEAHEAIRNLLGRYCELMDAGDFAGLGELFASAKLCGPDGSPFARGRDEIRDSWAARVHRYEDGSPRTRHVTTNTVIDVAADGRSATARSAYLVFQAAPAQALQPVAAGRYVDQFVADEDGWRFSERRFYLDLTGDLSRHLQG